MSTYYNSKGKEVDVSAMPYTYLMNALNKAKDNFNVDVANMLQAELDSRGTDDSINSDNVSANADGIDPGPVTIVGQDVPKSLL